MSSSLLHFTGAALGVAALLLAVAADCGFLAICRDGETYRMAIPCEGKCAFYVQCTNGVSAELKCGKFFFTQKYFDPVKLECVRDAVDCDWWKKSTTTEAPTPTTPANTTTLAPETTPSTSSTETTPMTSTEASSTTPAANTTTTEPPPTTPIPSSTSPPPPPEPKPTDSGTAPLAAPLAAAWPALLAAAVALIL